jgi:hypothetical protein
MRFLLPAAILPFILAASSTAFAADEAIIPTAAQMQGSWCGPAIANARQDWNRMLTYSGSNVTYNYFLKGGKKFVPPSSYNSALAGSGKFDIDITGAANEGAGSVSGRFIIRMSADKTILYRSRPFVPGPMVGFCRCDENAPQICDHAQDNAPTNPQVQPVTGTPPTPVAAH